MSWMAWTPESAVSAVIELYYGSCEDLILKACGEYKDCLGDQQDLITGSTVILADVNAEDEFYIRIGVSADSLPGEFTFSVSIGK